MSGFFLKILALILMFTEHFGYFFSYALSENIPLFLSYIGRIVAPIFIFLMVEGFFKTQNRLQYVIRLLLFAIIMMLGNIFLYNFVFSIAGGQNDMIPMNIFYSLFAGFVMMCSLENCKKFFKKSWISFTIFVLLFLFAIAFMMITEAGGEGVFMFLIMYFCYGNTKKLAFYYTIMCVFFFLVSIFLANGSFEILMQKYFGFFYILALPFLLCYNGKRGNGSLKYFFYVFYPMHIWILYFLSYYLR